MRRLVRRARPEHHSDDPVYWSRVAARYAERAERKAGRARDLAITAVFLVIVFTVIGLLS